MLIFYFIIFINNKILIFNIFIFDFFLIGQKVLLSFLLQDSCLSIYSYIYSVYQYLCPRQPKHTEVKET